MRHAIAAVFTALWLADASAQAPSTWHTTTIKYVYAGQVGGRVAVAVNEQFNIGTCPASPAGGTEFVLDVNNPFFRQMLAIIMTAYAAGKPINLFTNGECSSTGIMLTDVWLPM